MPRSIHSHEHVQLIKLLRELRERAGLRQIDLAERLNRPQSFVSKYEAGERRLDVIELRSVCAALGVDLVRVIRRWEREID
jgi:transcriptional regulator with XRE-family HTH domain